MDYNSALTQLDIILGDTSDTTFSNAEKSRALTRAWNDSFVVKAAWDSTKTYSQGVYQIALPTTITALQDIYISSTGTNQPMPDPISNDLWEVVASNIQFRQKADSIIPNGSTLYLKGRYKLNSVTDTLDSATLQEYVLSLAGFNTLTLLAHKKANLFIKNDTTMGELIGLRRELMADYKELRTKLAKDFESA